MSARSRQIDFLLTIVPDDGHIVLDVWIGIEKLVSLAIDEDSGTGETDTAIVNAMRSAGMAAACISPISRIVCIARVLVRLLRKVHVPAACPVCRAQSRCTLAPCREKLRFPARSLGCWMREAICGREFAVD